MFKVFIISNNPLVWDDYPHVIKVNGSLRQVLVKARDYVHQGYRLISHPLAGSVKPNETPFKSLVMEAEQKSLDFDSLRIIESAIEVTDKLPKLNRKWVFEDFRIIDSSLLKAAFEHFPPDFKFVRI